MVSKTLCLLLAGTALAAAGTAQAQGSTAPPGTGTGTGTGAGLSITNQAKASYTVNGTPREVNSTVASFVVDRKVNFTVERLQTTTTKVNLSQSAAVTTFTVTNLTNDTQDFLLDPDQQNLSLGVLDGTDNFDVSNMRAFVDSNGNGTYEPELDTKQYIDELAPNGSVTVLIVSDVPATPANANLAFVSLHVLAAPGGAPGTRGDSYGVLDPDLVNRPGEVDVVLADGDSDGGFAGDIARNGQGRAYAAYEIGDRDVALSVQKTSRVVSDGYGSVSPKALPGAVVEYCLVVRNGSTLTAASGISLTDRIPDRTTYVPNSIRVGGLAVGGTCLVDGPTEDDDTDDAGELDPYRGSFDEGTKTVTATIPTLPGNGALSASFQVRIN